MKKLSLLLAFIFAASNIGYAAKIADDTLKIGKPGSSANKEISLGSTRKIRANESTGKIEFSNDGTLYKNLGSGSGTGDGGTPINENASFEDGLTPGWTSSGGTFTQGTYTNGIESDTKYAQLVASTTGQYFETTAKAIPSFSVGGCLAKIDYYSTDASGTWKIQAYDGSSNLLGENSLDPKDWQSAYLPFKCPAIGTLVKMRVISTAAGTIKADRGYLGKENRTFQVAVAKHAGSSYFASTASCQWQKTSTTMSALNTDTDCPGPTISESSVGTWLTTDSDLPRQYINNLPAGKYTVTFSFANGATSAAGAHGYTLSDGTTTCNQVVTGVSTLNISGTTTVQCTFTYTTIGNRYFELFAQAAASSTVNVYNFDPRYQAGFSIEYSPLDSDTALRPEAQDWFIDANISGSTLSLGTSAQSSYVEMTDTSLALTLNTGSAAAKIPCSTTNPATGSTCSAGNESVGLVFTNPTPGYFEVCTNFGYEGAVSGIGATVIPVFQVVQTANSAQTILQEGKSRIPSRVYTSTANSVAQGNPVFVCGSFYFSDASEKTVRLMYEQFVNGSVSASQVHADANGSYGQRDIHLTVRPLLSPYNRPYLVGDQIVDKFNSDTATFAFSSSYNQTTLGSAPIGTFITYSYTASGNTRAQCATAPTQTAADMNTNGLLITTRVYASASTCALPAAFAIKVGSLKGYNATIFKSSGKVGPVAALDAVQISTNQYGLWIKTYNEATGVLYFDSGLVFTSSINGNFYQFEDNTAQSNGYLTIVGWGK